MSLVQIQPLRPIRMVIAVCLSGLRVILLQVRGGAGDQNPKPPASSNLAAAVTSRIGEEQLVKRPVEP